MKNLKNYDVLEMNVAEMKEVDGGVILLVNGIFIFAVYSAFMAGYDAACNC